MLIKIILIQQEFEMNWGKSIEHVYITFDENNYLDLSISIKHILEH